MTDLYEDCTYSPSPQRLPRTTEVQNKLNNILFNAHVTIRRY